MLLTANHLEIVLRHLHQTDNTIHDGSDRLFKWRPLLSIP